VAEDPLRQLSRLAAGIILMQGRLGHQVLGQLLIMNTSEIAMAGAALAIAATTGPRHEVAQIAVRTVVPAIAGHVVLKKQEERIDRKQALLDDREEEFANLRHEKERLDDEVKQLKGLLAAAESR
jgi:hypothetical protein